MSQSADRETKDRSEYIPQLSVEERDRRWADIRERMAQRGVDCLIIWGNDRAWGYGRANLRYLTHIPGQIDAVGIFPFDGEPVVFSEIPHMHMPQNVWNLYQDWVDDSRLYQGINQVVDEIKQRNLQENRLGIVGYKATLSQFNVSYSDLTTLMDALPKAEITDETDLVERARLIKSDEEIEMLREAGQMARKMAEPVLTAEPGQQECEVYADMIRTQIAEGGEAYIFNLFDSGSPTGNETKHLLHGKGQPISPSTRTLADGDLIITEYHANYGGYLAAAEKSVVLGNPPKELEDIHEVCLQCQENAMKSFRPGTRLEDVWENIRAPAEEAGMSFVELGFHGHGLASPEFPSTVYPQEPTHAYPEGVNHPIAGKGLEDIRLREGMVFGTNIDIYDPSWRDDVGLMFGDTFLVTDGEPERLVNTPKELIV
ncbi:M24 family metallopeptidase [Saliphagus sp. GCM10025334]